MLEKVLDQKQIKVEKLPYLLALPPGHNKTSSSSYPLVLFLHGRGERGSDLEKVRTQGLPKAMEGWRESPFIMVAPQCPEDSYWPFLLESLLSLLDDVCERYAVDQQRIYLTGLSMGGYGSWFLSLKAPDRFAAVAPICGVGIPTLADALKDTAVWAFHGEKDTVVPVEHTKTMVSAINKAGGHAKLTIYPEADHDSWTVTYENPEFFSWMLKQKKM
ncbi:prolyl oligopeptidase family serine peptidase [Aureibacillus halotolerans]|uniref:Dienelactone hydrolase family protein n=1 Tax=Aureibacillus halotolerans TaxID=1508390 RepID=A0A4R6TTJ5_9BACI|nr:prolyl oligopeptidase family serine peptidase [Aureibacillus halotolerans]TDQ36426.1 dienelactone hydrolase family protein [Aureibacillus halotolerans]